MIERLIDELVPEVALEETLPTDVCVKKVLLDEVVKLRGEDKLEIVDEYPVPVVEGDVTVVMPLPGIVLVEVR